MSHNSPEPEILFDFYGLILHSMNPDSMNQISPLFAVTLNGREGQEKKQNESIKKVR